MAQRLNIDTTIGNLRHYSAAELLSAGVDLRTTAGRLGHSGGGSTTLRVYAAWTSEADQRASAALAARTSQAPGELLGLEEPRESTAVRPIEASDTPHASETSEEAWTPADPYLQIAADLRAAICCGALREGDSLPSAAMIAERYQVAPSTAHRAVATLHDLGFIDVTRGRRATVSAAGWTAARTPFDAPHRSGET